MDRTQYTFYESFYKAAKSIKSKTVRCDLYDVICRYALYGEEPDVERLPDAVVMAYELIKPTLDSSRRKAENGKRRSLSKKAESKTEANESKTEANESKTEAKHKLEQSENKNKNENELELELENEYYIPPSPPVKGAPPKPRFFKPSVDDVKSYCQEHGYASVDAERFVDYYTANGWRVGKNPMKDWKAAVRTWGRQSGEYSRQPPVSRKQTKAEELDDFYRMAANWANEGENA